MRDERIAVAGVHDDRRVGLRRARARGIVRSVDQERRAARDELHAGTTKCLLSKMLKSAIDGVTSFSDVPLRFASYLGFTVSTVAFLYAIVIIFFRLFHLGIPEYTRGWASTMGAILFLGGVQLIGIGILGEYIGRINDEVKGRPLYLISDIERS